VHRFEKAQPEAKVGFEMVALCPLVPGLYEDKVLVRWPASNAIEDVLCMPPE
jgi:hypothetical protein